MNISNKFTTRNILANGTIGVFLWSIVYGVLNIDKVAKAIESSSVLSLLLGVFVGIVPIVYYFYFRKTQTKESLIPEKE